MSDIQAKVFQAPRGHAAPALRLVTHRLLKTRGYCPTGTRYMTRTNVRNLFLGKTQHALIRNDGSGIYPKQTRPMLARITRTRLRIGCHVWSGESFNILKAWALA